MYACHSRGYRHRLKMLWWTVRPLRSSANSVRACVLTILLCSLGYWFFCANTNAGLRTNFPGRKPANPYYATDADSCPISSVADKIVVSVKTGASEAATKAAAQLKTTLRCVKNVYLFSDLEQDIGEFHLHDAL